MSSATVRKAGQGNSDWIYQRRRPEQTLLYRLVEEHYPRLLGLLAAQGRWLPEYVQREFEGFLKCGRLEYGFLRVRCVDCHAERLVAFSCKRRGFCPSCGARRMVESAALLVDEVLPRLPMRQWVLSFPFQLRFLFASRPEVMSEVLGIVYRAIETHLIQQAGCIRAEARTGAVTLIQRFGSAVNLNIHFHMLLLDGVYVIGRESLEFRSVSPPSPKVLELLVQMISQRVGRYLERQGWLVRDIENSYLQLEALDDSAINDLLGHSITYRIAVGPQAGRKAFTLQTVPAREGNDDNSQVAKANGFSLHAGVAAKAHQRRKLERLCRYIARLAALVPKPRVNLTRFHGVFAPNSKHRSQVTPARRGKRPTDKDTTPDQRHTAMTWAQRLKRVFTIDIETCEQCGAAVKVIASIEDPAVIRQILDHLQNHTESPQTASHPVRAPPACPEPDQS